MTAAKRERADDFELPSKMQAALRRSRLVVGKDEFSSTSQCRCRRRGLRGFLRGLVVAEEELSSASRLPFLRLRLVAAVDDSSSMVTLLSVRL